MNIRGFRKADVCMRGKTFAWLCLFAIAVCSCGLFCCHAHLLPPSAFSWAPDGADGRGFPVTMFDRECLLCQMARTVDKMIPAGIAGMTAVVLIGYQPRPFVGRSAGWMAIRVRQSRAPPR